MKGHSRLSIHLPSFLKEGLLENERVILRVLEEDGGDVLFQKERKGQKEIRGKFLVWLATERKCVSRLVPKGLMLESYTITGTVDFNAAIIAIPLRLRSCLFSNEILLNEARTRTIELSGSSIPSIMADGVHVEGNLVLSDGTQINGILSLHGASIEGNLKCTGSRIDNEGGYAIYADLLNWVLLI